MCHFLLNNKCRHGKKGDDCPFHHPKHCTNFTTKGKDGCSEGKKCIYFHPKLCYDSVNKKEWYREKCNYFHLPKTTRIAEKAAVKIVENNVEFHQPQYSHAGEAQRTNEILKSSTPNLRQIRKLLSQNFSD